MIELDYPSYFIIFTGLGLIPYVIPPYLPLFFITCSARARDRLAEKQIINTELERIKYAGLVNCMCFDKTGTLTESGLSVLGYVPVNKEG